MKSRITIDVDHDNQPIIKIEHRDSPDVRDKLVAKFLSTFGSEVMWAKFCYQNYDPKEGKDAQIRPICAYDMPEEIKLMTAYAEEHIRMRQICEMRSPIPENETV